MDAEGSERVAGSKAKGECVTGEEAYWAGLRPEDCEPPEPSRYVPLGVLWHQLKPGLSVTGLSVTLCEKAVTISILPSRVPPHDDEMCQICWRRAGRPILRSSESDEQEW